MKCENRNVKYEVGVSLFTLHFSVKTERRHE